MLSSIISPAAPLGDQTGHKIPYTGRLLEEAPKAWHDPHRDLCDVGHL